MVEYVIDAFRDSTLVDKISIVGPRLLLEEQLNIKVAFYINEWEPLLDNVKVGIEPFLTEKSVLIITSDIPMITGEMIDDFINQCINRVTGFYHPIIEKSLNEQRFPSVGAYIEIGNDVDKQSDLDIAREYLSNISKFYSQFKKIK